jgi:hypothetical protein
MSLVFGKSKKIKLNLVYLKTFFMDLKKKLSIYNNHEYKSNHLHA